MELVELSATGNRIAAIPSGLSRLPKLQTLRLDSNRVAAVPPEVLHGCTSLSLLSLHDNPITADQLRSTDGFTAYDARRRALCDKQLDSAVMHGVSGAFSEGADQQEWQRWK